MEVFNIIAGNSCLVSFNGSFFNRVFDFRALFVILLQAGKAPGPLILFGHGLGVNLLAVSQEVDDNACRTELLHVIRVIPCLLAADRYVFRIKNRIGQVHAVRFGPITAHGYFGDLIIDQLAVFVLINILKGIRPFTLAVRPDYLARHLFFAVHQLHSNAGRTGIVLVLTVHPGLLAADIDFLRSVFVGDSIILLIVYGLFITFKFGFLSQGICQLLTVHVHRHALDRLGLPVFPVLRFDCYGIGRLDGNVFR